MRDRVAQYDTPNAFDVRALSKMHDDRHMTTLMMTVAEVAARLRVSQQTVRRWAATGQLPAARLPGGRMRFEWSAVEAFIVERTEEQEPTR